MENKILVTYSTRTGSTKEISEAIAKTLSETGEKVDIIDMKDVKDLTIYKSIIAGSAIQDRKWLPEAIEFVKINQADLNKKPFAAFLVCMTLAMKGGVQYTDTVSSWLQPVRNVVTPVSEGLFKGILEIDKIPSFSDRIKFRISMLTGVWKEGDHRDWDSIQTWTRKTKAIFDKSS
ncbi:MAG TPA: flavodoxin domain-containing protein [Bacteroidales bacterium]|nr:flavodoxin domain-containing protein [Bacteroidales bacterium]